MTIGEYLHSTKPPWIGVLCVEDEDSLLTFLAMGDIYIASVDGRNCRTKDGLMTEFAKKLKFPDYFGRNWDAVEDCLEDLEWLPLNTRCGGYAIFIIHPEELLVESPADYAIFVEIVKGAGEHWATPSFDGTGRSAVPFHVVLLAPRNKVASRDWGVPELDVQLPPTV